MINTEAFVRLMDFCCKREIAITYVDGVIDHAECFGKLGFGLPTVSWMGRPHGDCREIKLSRSSSFDTLLLMFGHELGHICTPEAREKMDDECNAWDWAVHFFNQTGCVFDKESIKYAIESLRTYEKYWASHDPRYSPKDKLARESTVAGLELLAKK
jgi:hypothetical protein